MRIVFWFWWQEELSFHMPLITSLKQRSLHVKWKRQSSGCAMPVRPLMGSGLHTNKREGLTCGLAGSSYLAFQNTSGGVVRCNKGHCLLEKCFLVDSDAPLLCD